jgi:hypothetical protein
MPRKERKDDPCEGSQDVEPLLALQPAEVAGGDTEGQLDQSDGDAELDRHHAREQDEPREKCCQLDGLHQIASEGRGRHR